MKDDRLNNQISEGRKLNDWEGSLIKANDRGDIRAMQFLFRSPSKVHVMKLPERQPDLQIGQNKSDAKPVPVAGWISWKPA